MAKKPQKSKRNDPAVYHTRLAFLLISRLAEDFPELSLSAAITEGTVTFDATLSGKKLPFQMGFDFGIEAAAAIVEGLLGEEQPPSGGNAPHRRLASSGPESDCAIMHHGADEQHVVGIDLRGNRVEDHTEYLNGPIVGINKRQRTLTIKHEKGDLKVQVNDGVDSLLRKVGSVQNLPARRTKGNSGKATYVVKLSDIEPSLCKLKDCPESVRLGSQ